MMCVNIFVKREVKIIYVIILIIFSVILAIILSRLFFSIKKSKIIFTNLKFSHKIFDSKRFQKLNNILEKMNNPYGLNLKKVIFIKYVISLIFFILMFFRTSNLIISFCYFAIIYFLPNVLIRNFQKNESIKIIKEVKNLTNNLALLLATNITFYDALKVASRGIKYKRFKEKYDIFVHDYSLYNFNLKPALNKFQENFYSDEFVMFVNILIQGDKEGKLLEMLEVFENTLDLSTYKYIKKKERKANFYIIIASFLSLVNIVIIAVYPMIIQIFENINQIFK